MCNARKRFELENKRDEVRKEMILRSAEATEALDRGDRELCERYEQLLDALAELDAQLMKEIAHVSAEMWK